jgi:hypothetical protein
MMPTVYRIVVAHPRRVPRFSWFSRVGFASILLQNFASWSTSVLFPAPGTGQRHVRARPL